MDDRIPETQTSGALVPPPRVPPTAVATSAPLPPREPRRHATSAHTTRSRSVELFATAFDALDRIGDRIADALGLR